MVAAIGLAGCSPSVAARPIAAATPIPARAVAAAPPPPTSVPALPPDVALGQMIGVSFSGTVVSPGLRHLIVEDKVGTVVLFRANFGTAAQLRRLAGDLESLGRTAGLPAPLLIALDQEGGSISQVDTGIPALPSPLVLGRRGPAGVRRAVAATAAGLRELGVGLDLAPVVDLLTSLQDRVIGDRSFGAQPAVVGPLGAAFVDGLHDGGVGATLKHFPGLGGAAGNPHLAVPTDPVSMATWQRTSARSFATGIAAGADAVMTTAVRVPGLDSSGSPALFSRTVVTGLLRDRLDFGGVIVTDSLSLGGIGALEGLPQATVDAASAGNDLLLLGNSSTDYEAQAIDALRAAIDRGLVPEDQVQASAARVLALRERYAVAAPSPATGPTPAG